MRTRSSLAAIEAISPPAGSPCINEARRAVSLSPSSSENTPATAAATSSPTLWPITATGTTPQLIQSAASAYSSANRAGWVYCVWSTSACSSGRSDHSTSGSGTGREGARISAH